MTILMNYELRILARSISNESRSVKNRDETSRLHRGNWIRLTKKSVTRLLDIGMFLVDKTGDKVGNVGTKSHVTLNKIRKIRSRFLLEQSFHRRIFQREKNGRNQKTLNTFHLLIENFNFPSLVLLRNFLYNFK